MASNIETSSSVDMTKKAFEKERKKNGKKLKATYLRLRAQIGGLVISLPIIVWGFDLMLRQGGIQPSISAYYHTEMRNWFVGSLFAIGFFLLTYNPGLVDDRYKHNPDQKFSLIAGILAIIVGLTPTGRIGWNDNPAPYPPLPPVIYDEGLLNNIHFIAVSLLFILLAYFSLVLFRKTDPDRKRSNEKKRRDEIYRWSGIIMAACVLSIGLHAILPNTFPEFAENIKGYNLVFYFEFVALLAFGISWFVKGEALKALNDKSP